MNPQLMLDEEEIMPTFWSNNYFSLSANESITLTVSCPQANLNGMQPKLVVSGWNVEKQSLALTMK
jgi:hypothetical protein